MKVKHTKYIILVLGLLFSIFSTSAFGAFTANYGDFGVGDLSPIDFLNVSETTDTEDVALYGAPVLVGNQQLFFPTNFVSEAQNGASDTTSGTLSMTLDVQTGFALSKVVITEIGRYSFDGSPLTTATNASLEATLTIGGQTTEFSTGPYVATVDPVSGMFHLTREIDFSGLGITTADFSLENLLTTDSETGTTATIQKQLATNNVQLEFYTAPVPIPGAVWLLGSGLLAVAGLGGRRFGRKP